MIKKAVLTEIRKSSVLPPYRPFEDTTGLIHMGNKSKNNFLEQNNVSEFETLQKFRETETSSVLPPYRPFEDTTGLIHMGRKKTLIKRMTH